MHWLEQAGLRPRATKDFDLVLVIESLDDRFLSRFWDFIREGGYINKQKSTGKSVFYRFSEPQDEVYPFMLEVFSRLPAQINITGEPTIIPIPAAEEASSLSAILLDEEYYAVIQQNRRNETGLSLLSPEGLIVLKAKAWLDLSRRRAEGQQIDQRDINKHRTDIFKLALLLSGERTTIPPAIGIDLEQFLDHFPKDSPEWDSIRNSSGLKSRMPEPGVIIEAIRTTFIS